MLFRPVWTPLRWLVVAIMATLTYLAHLSGFAFLGLSIAILWLLYFRKGSRPYPKKRCGVSSGAGACRGDSGNPMVEQRSVGRLDRVGSLTKKATALGSVFLGFRYDLDVAAVLLLATAVAIAAFRGGIGFHPGLLTLAAAFLCGSILCPSQLAPGGGDGADARFVPAGMVFLFLSCTVLCSRRAAHRRWSSLSRLCCSALEKSPELAALERCGGGSDSRPEGGQSKLEDLLHLPHAGEPSGRNAHGLTCILPHMR